ncbi:MAG: rhomboid family intramembrane serine protease [Isosphaeraceae bacterium]|nr:rhomboid family intramembrane serine protease [Isosphaeraceae bacterium]
MFFIFPITTDAPIFYWPRATVGLIVTNVLAYLLTREMGLEDRMAYALLRGHGFHPLQWLTAMFMHADYLHLIGNMVFLWGFGIIVEGKLGPWKYVPIYLGVGMAHMAAMQAISLHTEHGFILGASAAIYGLMAMAMLWAPESHLQCWYAYFFLFRVGVGSFEIEVVRFSLIFIALEVVTVLLTGGAMSTAFLHLTGAIIGLAVGLVLFFTGQADCENLDIFAVISNRRGMSRAEARERRDEEAREKALRERPKDAFATELSAEARKKLADAAHQHLRQRLTAGDAAGAYSAYIQARDAVPGWSPEPKDWLLLMKVMADAAMSRDLVRVMEHYVATVRNADPRVRLKLAHILLRDHDRPAHALTVLEGLDSGPLPTSLDDTRDRLVATARRRMEEGVLELSGGDW